MFNIAQQIAKTCLQHVLTVEIFANYIRTHKRTVAAIFISLIVSSYFVNKELKCVSKCEKGAYFTA